MSSNSPNRRTAPVFALVLIVAISLLSAGGAAAFLAQRTGDGKMGKVTKTTVSNAGGVYSAQGSVNHFAIEGTKNGTFTVDVKDASVEEINYFGSTFCFVPKSTSGEPEAITKSFNGTKSVDGRTKAKVKVRLPGNHVGCDLSIIATVLRPGDGITQTEIIVRKMVLTATAS